MLNPKQLIHDALNDIEELGSEATSFVSGTKAALAEVKDIRKQGEAIVGRILSGMRTGLDQLKSLEASAIHEVEPDANREGGDKKQVTVTDTESKQETVVDTSEVKPPLTPTPVDIVTQPSPTETLTVSPAGGASTHIDTATDETTTLAHDTLESTAKITSSGEAINARPSVIERLVSAATEAGVVLGEKVSA